MQSKKDNVEFQMGKLCLYAGVILALILCCGASSFAQNKYYVLTNDSAIDNTATIFRLNTANGSLAQVKELSTNGLSEGGGFFGAVTQAISPGAACIFVSNSITSNISTFSKATQYGLVGEFFNQNLGGGYNMALQLNKAGTILYGSYYGSSTLGVWQVNGDCSLTFANFYNTDFALSSLAITHDGKTLLATYNGNAEAQSWAISGTTLTSNGVVTTSQIVSGLAVTADDKVVVMGTTGTSSAVITASLPGFTNQQTWNLGPGYSAGSVALSAGGAAGNGCLYVGNSGNGNNGMAGVTGALFQENPVSVTYVNHETSSFATYIGNVAPITNAGSGGGVYAAETVGNIGVFAANSACTVKLPRETADPQSKELYSLTALQQ